MNEFLPTPDSIPVAWGWFQFLLLLTFPLHLLAMNAMVGSTGIALIQHFKGGELRKSLAHRIAIALPLVIAFAVNFGVAPLLFVQVLYGHFIYTSSILMGLFWIFVIPLLIVAYYGAYLYDFRFEKLGKLGPWILLVVLVLMVIIGYFFSNNMLMMTLPDQFAGYFDHMGGDMLVSGNRMFLPRFLHMMVSAFAVGGLFVAILGTFGKDKNPELTEHAGCVGMRTFAYLTMFNILLGVWFLLAIPRETMMLFMGQNMLATVFFTMGLVLTIVVIVTAMKKKVWLTTILTVILLYVMSFMRAYMRTDFLDERFTLDQLKVIPEYSPLILFLVTLVVGLAGVAWLIHKTVQAMKD